MQYEDRGCSLGNGYRCTVRLSYVLLGSITQYFKHPCGRCNPYVCAVLRKLGDVQCIAFNLVVGIQLHNHAELCMYISVHCHIHSKSYQPGHVYLIPKKGGVPVCL